METFLVFSVMEQQLFIELGHFKLLPDRSSAVNLKMRRLVGNIDPIPMARRLKLIKASSSPYSEGTVERGLARVWVTGRSVESWSLSTPRIDSVAYMRAAIDK